MTPHASVVDAIRAAAAADESRAVRSFVAELKTLDASAVPDAAGEFFERCADTCLARLLQAAGAWDDEAAHWVQGEFHAATSRLGQSLRAAVPDANERHTVAQILQQKMLEAELHLRDALDARNVSR